MYNICAQAEDTGNAFVMVVLAVVTVVVAVVVMVMMVIPKNLSKFFLCVCYAYWNIHNLICIMCC